MSINKMKLVRISGPSSKLDKVISVCCALGSFHPEHAENFISDTMGYKTVNEESPYAATISDLKELAAAYDIQLEGDTKTKIIEIDEKTNQYISETADKLRKLAQSRRELDEQAEVCETAIKNYSHFIGLGLDFKEIFDCKFIKFRFGRLPKDGYQKLIKGYSDNPYILFNPCSMDENGYWGAYFAPSDKASQVDRIFAALQFERLIIPKAVGTAEEILDSYNQNIEIIRKEEKEIESEVKNILDGSVDRFRAIYRKISDMNLVFEAKKYAVFNNKSCFFVGWIPAKDEAVLKEKLANFTNFTVDFEDPSAKHNVQPPVKLKNFRLFSPFEYFVEMYGLPSYNEMDITGFVAIMYILLFGIMFGDLGQGLIVSLVGLFMYKKSGSGLGKILVPCGLSSAFFGLIFGSVFGFEEALNPLYTKLGMSGKPIEVMESINTVLLFAISIGIALVIIAMCINVIGSFKKGKPGTAIFSENGLVGIMTYVAGVSLIYQFMSHKAIIPSAVAAIMLVVGILILFNKEILAESVNERKFVKPESISDYIMQNFFEVIEYMLSYFSNTVSFLRVGAFVIVHASMMMVVFTLAGDPKSISGMFIILLGNVLVIALEGLLTGIQGLRLTFYEMFSRFYEGEGKPFMPIGKSLIK